MVENTPCFLLRVDFVLNGEDYWSIIPVPVSRMGFVHRVVPEILGKPVKVKCWQDTGYPPRDTYTRRDVYYRKEVL